MGVASPCDSVWATDVRTRVGRVYAKDPKLRDHRKTFPRWDGFLGNPSAGTWFIADYPSTRSLHRVERATATCEAQWHVTPGDLIFRATLERYGFERPNAT